MNEQQSSMKELSDALASLPAGEVAVMRAENS